MKFALIGHTGHIDYYRQSLQDLPDVRVVAAAKSIPEETLSRFDAAPGVTPDTKRYEDYLEMLDRESPDVVQICARADLIPGLIRECIGRGVAVMAEKPFATDLDSLYALYDDVGKSGVPLAPLFGYRRMKCFEAVRDAVRSGRIGEPVGGSSQISYRWGKSRPDYFRSRAAFPGIVPFIGIHVVDWLVWIVGDVFVEVAGWESTAPHPDYPGCASQAGLLLRQANGGAVAVTLDFLRPMSAPTHGDERVRITGTAGVVESAALDERATLIAEGREPEVLPNPATPHWYTAFLKHVRGEGESFISVRDAFRVTEIALKAQLAVDSGDVVSLAASRFKVE